MPDIVEIITTQTTTYEFAADETSVVEINTSAPIGIPAGGTTGQVLAKASNADYDTEWIANKERLTVDTTFYIRTDGNDSNTGLADTSGAAWLTLNGAYNNILNNYDPASGITITLQLADGTYSGFSNYQKPGLPVPLYIRGNNAAPQNVIIQSTSAFGTVINNSSYSPLRLCLFSLTVHGGASNHTGVSVEGFGNVIYVGLTPNYTDYRKVRFTGAITTVMNGYGGGYMYVYGDIDLVLTVNPFALVYMYGQCFCEVGSATFTFVNAAATTSAFLHAINNSRVAWYTGTVTGTNTGRGYRVGDAGSKVEDYGANIGDGLYRIDDHWPELPALPAATIATTDQLLLSDASDSSRMKTITALDLQKYAGREKLTADTTYYVRTDGSDSNTGTANTAGGAWLTLQKAWDWICENLDLNSYRAIVQIANGTYDGFTTVGPGGSGWDSPRVPFGNGAVEFVGDTTTPANVVLDVEARSYSLVGIYHALLQQITVKGVTFDCTSAVTWMQASGQLNIQNFRVTNATGQYVFNCENPGSKMAIVRCHEIVGGCAVMYYVGYGAYMSANNDGHTFLLTSSPAWGTAFIQANVLALGSFYSMGGSGSATGKRYDATNNAVLNLFGSGGSLPGSVAGTTGTGGIVL
jgi:hypothetical protein